MKTPLLDSIKESAMSSALKWGIGATGVLGGLGAATYGIKKHKQSQQMLANMTPEQKAAYNKKRNSDLWGAMAMM